jgi:hypothetical protein
MTNILFGTNVDCIAATAAATSTATGYSANNLLTGARGLTWKTDGAVATASVKYTATTAVNFFAVAGAHTASDVPGSTVNLILTYSDDDSSYDAWGSSGATAVTAIGANSASGEDYCLYAAASASHPYWMLTVNPSADAIIELSKVYLGTALDLGRDPSSIQVRRVSAGQFEYRSAYEINLEYQGIDYDTAESLLNNVITRAAYHPLFIFTSESNTYSDGPLANNSLYFVELIAYDMPQKLTAWNDISLTLRECP